MAIWRAICSNARWCLELWLFNVVHFLIRSYERQICIAPTIIHVSFFPNKFLFVRSSSKNIEFAFMNYEDMIFSTFNLGKRLSQLLITFMGRAQLLCWIINCHSIISSTPNLLPINVADMFGTGGMNSAFMFVFGWLHTAEYDKENCNRKQLEYCKYPNNLWISHAVSNFYVVRRTLFAAKLMTFGKATQ